MPGDASFNLLSAVEFVNVGKITVGDLIVNGQIGTNGVFTGEPSIVTTGSVGVKNTNPTHLLDVGSNVYIDDSVVGLQTINIVDFSTTRQVYIGPITGQSGTREIVQIGDANNQALFLINGGVHLGLFDRVIPQSNVITIGCQAAQGLRASGGIAIGAGSVNTLQGTNAIALGINAGRAQNNYAICIGENAGANQGESAIAIGRASGQSQDLRSIAIGFESGYTQENSAIAIGANAGGNQNEAAIAIGQLSGQVQDTYSIAIGAFSGVNQNNFTVAIGQGAGFSQSDSAIAIGRASGQSQDLRSIAIGFESGYTQENSAIAIGQNAGFSQSTNSIAVGQYAGQTQGTYNIALGYQSGGVQASSAIAIGKNAGTNQSSNAIAIGINSGGTQGLNSIAIGANSSTPNSNSIVLNASGSLFATQVNSAFYVNPVRETNVFAMALGYSSDGEIIQAQNLILPGHVISRSSVLPSVGSLSSRIIVYSSTVSDAGGRVDLVVSNSGTLDTIETDVYGLANVVFGASYSDTPSVVVTPGNVHASQLNPFVQVYPGYFQVCTATSSVSGGNHLKFNYSVMGV
jgi:hypothetical protein